MTWNTEKVLRGSLPISSKYHEVINRLARATLGYQTLRDRVISFNGSFTFNASTKDRLDIPGMTIQLDGETHIIPAQSAVDWDAGGETINTGGAAAVKWGAWYATIDAKGTVTFTPMTISDDMVYASELAALAAINGDADTNALPAGVLWGILTLQTKASQTFTADTTEFDNSTVLNAVNFHLLGDSVVTTGSRSAMITAHTAVAVHSTPEQLALTGTAVAKIQGRQVSLAAATAIAFTVADTINTGAATGSFYGGWLLLRDRAGNTYTLAAHGSGAAGDQVYATAALAQAALDALFIPPIYAVVAQAILCSNEDVDWVAITDDLDDGGDLLTATLTVRAAADAYEDGGVTETIKGLTITEAVLTAGLIQDG